MVSQFYWPAAYFIWGYIKDFVYKLKTIQQLSGNICAEIRWLQPDLFSIENVFYGLSTFCGFKCETYFS